MLEHITRFMNGLLGSMVLVSFGTISFAIAHKIGWHVVYGAFLLASVLVLIYMIGWLIDNRPWKKGNE